MKDNLQEIVVAILLVVLLVLLLQPSDNMSPSVFMSVLVGVGVIFITFAVFMWREKAADEREALHVMLAGRVGFLAGSSVLVLAVILQGLRHAIDPWVVIALSAMVLAKAAALVYGKLHR